MTWFVKNISTISITLILLAVVALIIAKLIRDKRDGKSSCGCGCAHCSMAGQCHKNN